MRHLLVLLLSIAACAHRPPAAAGEPGLFTALYNAAGEEVGQAWATPSSEGLTINARFWGLQPEVPWVLEMRDGPACGGPGFSTAGAPWGPVRPFVIGPWTADVRGGAWVRTTTPQLAVRGPAGVLGRPMVLRPEATGVGFACGVFAPEPRPRTESGTPPMTEIWVF